MVERIQSYAAPPLAALAEPSAAAPTARSGPRAAGNSGQRQAVLTASDGGKLMLRLTLGLLILMHGFSKLVAGPGPILDLMTEHSLPPAFAYFVYVGEVAAPLLLIVGLWTRPAALIVAVNMIVAVLLVHTAQLFMLSQTGGWALELQGFYLFMALAIALLGAGRISLGGKNGVFN